MSLESLQQEKEKLQDEISRKIDEFQNKYNVNITDINISTTITRNLSGTLNVKNTKVNIEIYL